MSPEKVKEILWHSRNKSTDDTICHPIDCDEWKNIDEKWPAFANEPRNLRLGLAFDGFNPFGIQSSTYSC